METHGLTLKMNIVNMVMHMMVMVIIMVMHMVMVIIMVMHMVMHMVIIMEIIMAIRPDVCEADGNEAPSVQVAEDPGQELRGEVGETEVLHLFFRLLRLLLLLLVTQVIVHSQPKKSRAFFYSWLYRSIYMLCSLCSFAPQNDRMLKVLAAFHPNKTAQRTPIFTKQGVQSNSWKLLSNFRAFGSCASLN